MRRYFDLSTAGDFVGVDALGQDLSDGIFVGARMSTAKLDHSHHSEGHSDGHHFAPAETHLHTPDVPDIPADTSTTATITIGGPRVTGEVGAGGDHDWFAVEMTAGQSYTFHMVANGENPTEDPLMRLFDSNGTFILENDDVDDPDSSDPAETLHRSSQIIFTPTTTGTYYISAQGWVNNGVQTAGEYAIYAHESGNPGEATVDELAYFLTNQFAPQELWANGQVNYYIGNMPAAVQTLILAAFDYWDDVANITFTAVSQANATMTFTDNEEGAFSSTSSSNGNIISNTINVSQTDWIDRYGTDLYSYSFQTYVHEIGHAIGLGHQGPYNGNADFAINALFSNDNWNNSVMSYMDPRDANSGTYQFILTPMIADIVAIQNLYGANTSTRGGDTVYINNSNAGGVFDFTQFSSIPGLTIYDTGGTDTIDASSYDEAQTIDLNEHAFSSIGGRVNNVSIARGSVIENAFGGTKSDILIGNDSDNTFRGYGGGTDRITGNGGNDTVIFRGASTQYTITDLGDGSFRIADSVGGRDWISILVTVEYAQFTDMTVELAAPAGPSYTEGADTQNGTAEADTIDALGGDDTIDALAGDDLVTGGAGNDALTGGAGSDTSVYSGASSQYTIVNNGDGTYTVTDNTASRDGVDTLTTFEFAQFTDTTIDLSTIAAAPTGPVFTENADTEVGTADADTLSALGGDDVIDALGGDDIVTGGAGNDSLTGGAGSDTSVYSGASTQYTIVNNGDGTYTVTDNTASRDGVDTLTTFEFAQFTDTTIDLSTIMAAPTGPVFTEGADTANGTSGDDTLDALGGNDIITGGAGNDNIDGGAGMDTAVFSGAFADYTLTFTSATAVTALHLAGGADGTDMLDNIEVLRFSDGDLLFADAGQSGEQLTLGDDVYTGDGGNNVINGLSGRDILSGLGGDDILRGGGGNDDFFGGAGADTFDGGSGDDRVFYSDALAGVTANFIDQSLNTGEALGDSYISIESINGSEFDDFITSGNDDNDLIGLGGADILVGAGGNDRLFGGDGDDRLLGGAGNDDMFGQGGSDTFVVRAGAGQDRIFDFTQGEDTLEFEGGPSTMGDLVIAQVGADTHITSFNGVTVLIGITATALMASDFSFVNPLPSATGTTVTTDLDGNDNEFAGDENADVVNGLGGDDTLRGGIGDDTLNGGDGNDTLYGGLGADMLNGGEGIDRVFYSDAATGVTANFIDQTLNTGEAAGDTYTSIESITGSQYDDFITSGNDDNDLIGIGGNDILVGAGGDDRLFGGEGNDRLLGGTGNDDLFGQGGNDTFVIRSGGENDRIFDFVQGEDMIEFEGGPGGFADLTIVVSGTTTVITSSNGVTTLIGFTDALTAADFLFVNPAGGTSAKPEPTPEELISDDAFTEDGFVASDVLADLLASASNSDMANMDMGAASGIDAMLISQIVDDYDMIG